jgi:hypothetical protein
MLYRIVAADREDTVFFPLFATTITVLSLSSVSADVTVVLLSTLLCTREAAAGAGNTSWSTQFEAL